MKLHTQPRLSKEPNHELQFCHDHPPEKKGQLTHGPPHVQQTPVQHKFCPLAAFCPRSACFTAYPGTELASSCKMQFLYTVDTTASITKWRSKPKKFNKQPPHHQDEFELICQYCRTDLSILHRPLISNRIVLLGTPASSSTFNNTKLIQSA